MLRCQRHLPPCVLGRPLPFLFGKTSCCLLAPCPGEDWAGCRRLGGTSARAMHSTMPSMARGSDIIMWRALLPCVRRCPPVSGSSCSAAPSSSFGSVSMRCARRAGPSGPRPPRFTRAVSGAARNTFSVTERGELGLTLAALNAEFEMLSPEVGHLAPHCVLRTVAARSRKFAIRIKFYIQDRAHVSARVGREQRASRASGTEWGWPATATLLRD